MRLLGAAMAASLWATSAGAAVLYTASGTGTTDFGVGKSIDSYTFGPGVFEVALDLDRALDVNRMLNLVTVWNEFANADGSYVAGNDYHDLMLDDLGVGSHFVTYVTARSTAPEPGQWGDTYRIWYSQAQVGYSVAVGDQGPVNWTLTVSSVPEPATWAMIIIGFGVVGAALRCGGARRAA